jgi:transcriptional regulator GlxA family with amidase domain
LKLGRQIGRSPHHLSRIFSRVTGSIVGRYRGQLRVSRAPDRIADGDTSLAYSRTALASGCGRAVYLAAP